MNRYRTLTTDDPAIAILDTIIRFPVESEDAMTPEAKAIRQKLPALIKITKLKKTKAKFIEVTTGLGWQPWPDMGIDRETYTRAYKEALNTLGAYLEQTGELYEGLVVA